MRTFGSYSHDTHNSIRQEAKGPAPAARGLGLESARAGRAFATIAVLDVHDAGNADAEPTERLQLILCGAV